MKIIPNIDEKNLKFIHFFERKILSNYKLTEHLITKNNTNLLNKISEIKLKYIFSRSLKTPAYVKFLKKNKIKINKYNVNEINNIIPITTKKNYIRKYSLEDRCINKQLPFGGNIDESSGASGIPTNWIRNIKEEEFLYYDLEFIFKRMFDKGDVIIGLSAWSLGPWATGIKVNQLCEKFCLVKSIGTNKENIMKTMKLFGPKHKFIISGYPIFLEDLFNEDFPWKKYKIDILTGGDPCPVDWTKRIKQRIGKSSTIVSNYGCSDVDIGIGFETLFAQEIREECVKNKQLRHQLFGNLETIPMLFQFNPLLHYIHNLPNNKFAITHLDHTDSSPKIKYDIQDLGQKIEFNTVEALLEKYAPKILKKYQKTSLKLPFLWVGGREDGTISLDGANIFPENLNIIINKKFKKEIHHFKIARRKEIKKPFLIEVELKKGIKPNKELKQSIQQEILSELPKLNKDYKESLENNKWLKPHIKLFTYENGPFKKNNSIKYNFIDKK